MAPFLVVPAILGVLLLSVDLIEYQPAAPPRATPVRVRPEPAARPGPVADPMFEARNAAVSASVVESPMPKAQGMVEAPPMGPGLPAWVGESSGTARP